MNPKTSTLPDDEVTICTRVRTARELLKWNMPDFAERLGVTRDRLASHEYGRAPLRFDLGHRITREFNINQRWLVEGKEPRFMFLEISEELVNRIDPKMLYSAAYYKYFKDLVSLRLAEMGKRWNLSEERLIEVLNDYKLMSFEPIGAGIREQCLYLLDLNNKVNLATLPPDLWVHYREAIEQRADLFIKKHKKEMDKYLTQLTITGVHPLGHLKKGKSV